MKIILKVSIGNGNRIKKNQHLPDDDGDDDLMAKPNNSGSSKFKNLLICTNSSHTLALT